VVYRGETSDMAYFILKGTVGVGYIREQEYVVLRYLHEGDLFGEVAALKRMQRTANVITEEDCEFLIIPAKVMRRLARQYLGWSVILDTTIGERLSLTERPLGAGYDQQMLRELRTSQPETKDEPISAQIGV
jgi:CRP/FNR family cyclic AMP-dependent transcriptional regulator